MTLPPNGPDPARASRDGAISAQARKVFWLWRVPGFRTNNPIKIAVAIAAYTVFGCFLILVGSCVAFVSTEAAKAPANDYSNSREKDSAPNPKNSLSKEHKKPQSAERRNFSVRHALSAVTPPAKLPTVTEAKPDELAEDFVKRAYPKCTIVWDRDESGSDGRIVGYKVTEPNRKKVIATCEFVPDTGQEDVPNAKQTGHYRLDEMPFDARAPADNSSTTTIGSYAANQGTPQQGQTTTGRRIFDIAKEIHPYQTSPVQVKRALGEPDKKTYTNDGNEPQEAHEDWYYFGVDGTLHLRVAFSHITAVDVEP